MGYALAALGFAAFLCHDFQLAGRLRGRVFRWGFAAGTALWAADFVWLVAACARFTVPARLIPWSAAALVSLAAELYALFFALPKSVEFPLRENTSIWFFVFSLV